MAATHANPRLMLASGTIGTGPSGKQTLIRGLVVYAPVVDGHVEIYSTESAGPTAALVMKVAAIKGDTKVVDLPFRLPSQGYAVLVGGAQLSVLLD